MEATITVNNVWSRISGLKNVELVDMLDKKMSYYVEGYRFTRAFTHGYRDKDGQWRHWDGKRHLLTRHMVFPTGLCDRVKQFLEFHKVPYVVDDRRPRPLGDPLRVSGHTPRPYQQEAADAAFNAGRGIIRIGTGGGKCLKIGTSVLKHDGSICSVEDIKTGDLLMGPDSLPRRVLSTTRGQGTLFEVVPVKGDPWVCNDVHVLTLQHTVTGDVIDIPIDEYLKKNRKFKHEYKQFRTGVDFPFAAPLPVDPYFLGLWFGDGTKTLIKLASEKNPVLANVSISNTDEEVLSAITQMATAYGARVTTRDEERCLIHAIVTDRGRPNPVLQLMRSTLDGTLSIPQCYLTASRANRLMFLAGWIDSDGYLHNNSYEIVQKRCDYANGICFVARSLGFRALLGKKRVNGTLYHRVSISGDVSRIPVRIRRKKASPRTQKKDVLRTGFKVRPAGKGDYAGFELDGDGRFLLGDFTVTHNTFVASMMIARHNVPSMIYVIGKDLLYQFHEELVKALGPDDVGIIGDGLCDVRKFNVCSIWTAATAFGLKSKSVSLDDEDWQPEVLDLNAAKKGEIKRAVTDSALAIFDEAHFIACDTIQSIFKASKKCRYMFGLTGTDWRDDGADLLLESVCGERIYNAKSSTLIDQGYLVPPKIVMLEMPKHPDITKKMTWSEVYSRYITNSDDRNEAVVKAAKQLISMGRKVLILVRYLKHGKNIVDMMGDVSVFFVSGELDGGARLDVKKRFEAGKLQCLIASSVFDIGVDIPSLDALVLAGGGKSTVRALQRIGRVIRGGAGKTDALVVDFIDNAKYLDKHSATRIAVYETEPRFQIKFPEGFNRGSLKKIRKVKAKIR